MDQGTMDTAGCLGIAAFLVSLIVVPIVLHASGYELIPTRLTDEERCQARGERLAGHTGDEIRCEHVDFDAILDHQHCRDDWSKANDDCRTKIGSSYTDAYLQCESNAEATRKSCQSEDAKTYCQRTTEQKNANSGHIFCGMRWFDSEPERERRDNAFDPCWKMSE